MDRVINIAVDVTGSPEGLSERIAGCVNACSEHDDVSLTLLGDVLRIESELKAYGANAERITALPVSQSINKTDAPVQAVRDRQDSALVKGLTLVKNGEAGAFLSCSDLSFLKTGAQMILGRIDRLNVTPMATIMMGRTKQVLLMDSGMTGSEIKPSDLVLFARMGTLYMRFITSEQKPVVGLLSDSAVPENGGMLYRDGYELLKRFREIEFCGTVTPADILRGKADIVVCDGFAGGLCLNLLNGLAEEISANQPIKRRRHIFGKNKEQETDLMYCGPDLEGKGITFFPGIRGNVLAISEKPYRETVQKAIGYGIKLTKEDIKGRLISFLRL